jgi:hypothetical protein
MQNQVGPGILTCEVASSVLTGGKRHTRTWLFCILCVLGLILCLASCSRSVETPARQISPAQTQSQPEPAPLSAPPENAPAISIPVVTRKLYIDSPDMEEIIEANLRLKAADYGFRVVPNRSDADVVLEGSAGIFKQEGLFGTCVPFYAFDVVRQGGPRRREEPVFKLQLGVPNNHPCIRFAVAQKILSDFGADYRQTVRLWHSSVGTPTQHAETGTAVLSRLGCWKGGMERRAIPPLSLVDLQVASVNHRRVQAHVAGLRSVVDGCLGTGPTVREPQLSGVVGDLDG